MGRRPNRDGSDPGPSADVRLPAGQQVYQPLGTTLRAPWARVLITSLLILAALAYVVDRTLPGGLGSLSARLFPPNPPRVVMSTATPNLPTPAPAAGLLPAPPTNCPSAPSLDSELAQPSGFSQPVLLLGQSPTWVPQGYLPQGTVILEQVGTPEPYPSLKILWTIGPTQHPEVTVRVTDLQTGNLAWWTNQSGTPATPTLDLPAQADVSGWTTTPTAVAITHTGCYRLDVSWNGGKWSTIFAAGGSSRP